MEPRKIIIIDSKNQSQKVINNSTATTLGELKREMRERGISYEGSTFYCGQMRAELKDDSAPLPEVVMYKGQEARNLTFMLTTPDKKIKSGAMSRMEAYAEIKKKGLQAACVAKYGRNFTQCSTSDLISLIASNTKAAPVNTEKPIEKEKIQETPAACGKEEEKDAETEVSKSCDNCNCKEAIKALLEDLYDGGIIEEETHTKCMAILEGKKYEKPEKMSKKEIDEMFNFVDR